MRWAGIIGGVAVAAALAGAAFWWFAPYNLAASTPHFASVRWLLGSYMENAVRVRANGIEIPPQIDPSDPALIRLGAGHFASGCMTCHGAPGIARNPVVLGMRPAPPDLHQSQFDLREFYWIARHGLKYTGMPAWPGEGRQAEPWAVAAFLAQYAEVGAEEFEELAFGRAEYQADAIRFAGLRGPIDGAQTCARCHGADGMGRDGTAPILAGQSADWLEQVLAAYAEGDRESGFMEPLAAPLWPEARTRIAQGYASMGAPWQGVPLPIGDPVRGGVLAEQGHEAEDIPACAGCHEGGGEDGLSPRRPDTPRIAGQHGLFLYNWLLMYRDGPVPDTERAHLMARAAEDLSDADIADLAAHYSRLRPGVEGSGEDAGPTP